MGYLESILLGSSVWPVGVYKECRVEEGGVKTSLHRNIFPKFRLCTGAGFIGRPPKKLPQICSKSENHSNSSGSGVSTHKRKGKESPS